MTFLDDALAQDAESSYEDDAFSYEDDQPQPTFGGEAQDGIHRGVSGQRRHLLPDFGVDQAGIRRGPSGQRQHLLPDFGVDQAGIQRGPAGQRKHLLPDFGLDPISEFQDNNPVVSNVVGYGVPIAAIWWGLKMTNPWLAIIGGFALGTIVPKTIAQILEKRV